MGLQSAISLNLSGCITEGLPPSYVSSLSSAIACCSGLPSLWPDARILLSTRSYRLTHRFERSRIIRERARRKISEVTSTLRFVVVSGSAAVLDAEKRAIPRKSIILAVPLRPAWSSPSRDRGFVRNENDPSVTRDIPSKPPVYRRQHSQSGSILSGGGAAMPPMISTNTHIAILSLIVFHTHTGTISSLLTKFDLRQADNSSHH